jgi:alpha-glucosidase
VRAAAVVVCLLAAACSASVDGNEGTPSPSRDAVADDAAYPEWYRDAVFYQIFPRSFRDSDGDGNGDLRGVIEKLPYLADLGVRAIWLNPTFPSPWYDSGYDVADYEDVDPRLGTMDDMDALLAAAHAVGIRVLLDGVFNHTSHEHAWFRESRSGRDGPKRDWYIWRDVPDLWCFAGGAFGDGPWTYDDLTGQYFYHRFRPQQPELNFGNADVREAILDVARFWFGRGVDGFRLDVAGQYYDDPEVCEHHPRTHAFLKELRRVAREYGDRVFVAEAGGRPDEQLAYFGDGGDEMQMAFHFDLPKMLYAGILLRLPGLLEFLERPGRLDPPEPAAMATFLNNHDFFRGYDILLRDEGMNRLAATALLTLPGVPFVYYGTEIGMANGLEWPTDYRDAARTPMQWDATEQAGFTSGRPWIALASNHATHNVAVEKTDSDSLLNHTRRLIAVRNRTRVLRRGAYVPASATPRAIHVFFRTLAAEEPILVVLNFGKAPAGAAIDLAGSPWDGQSGAVRDLYADAEAPPLAAGAVSYSVTVEGWGGVILRLRP